MNNLDETIKKILFNMNYDSKTTLSENRTLLSKNILNEQTPPYICGNQNYKIKCKSQKVYTIQQAQKYGKAPTEGPQSLRQYGQAVIWRFQEWVWKNVDGNELPPNGGYSNTTCSTILSDSPKAGRTLNCGNPNDIDIDGAIDGYIGQGNSKTEKAWETWGNLYKAVVKDWNEFNTDSARGVSGIVQPISGTQMIKNFQKWFLEEYENNLMKGGKYDTELCKVNGVKYPCTYDEAVDGNWGESTQKAWEYKKKGESKTAGELYKDPNSVYKGNKNWDLDVEWDVDLEKQKEIYVQTLTKSQNLSKLPYFYLDPSGYKGNPPPTTISPYDLNTSNSQIWKKDDSADGYFGNGWDLKTNIFPFPVPYTKEQMALICPSDLNYELQGNNNFCGFKDISKLSPDKRVEVLTKRASVLKAMGIETSPARETVYNKSFDKTTATDIYLQLKTETENEYKDYRFLSQEKELIDQANETIKQMIKFNEDLKNQPNLIGQYCYNPYYLPIEFQNNIFRNLKINKYYLCAGLGGLWVRQENMVMTCGCRYKGIDTYLDEDIIGEIDWISEGLYNGTYAVNIHKTLYGDTSPKRVRDYTGKEIAEFVRDITLPLTGIAILFSGGLGTIPLAIILSALDIADLAASIYLEDPYAIGLSLMCLFIGAADLIKLIPSAGKYIDNVSNEIIGYGTKWRNFVEDFTSALIAKNYERLSKYYDFIIDFMKRSDEILRRAQFYTNSKKWKDALKKGVTKGSENAVEFSKVFSKVLKTLLDVLKELAKTPADFIEFIVKLLTSETGFFNFARLILINIPGPFITWDYMAYKLGICNTQSFSESVKEYDQVIELMKNSPDALTEEQKEQINKPLTKVLVGAARKMQVLQPYSTTCKRISAVEVLLDSMNSDEFRALELEDKMKEYAEKQVEEFKSINQIIIEELETIQGTYTPTGTFDKSVYFIQSTLNDFLKINKSNNDGIDYNINLDVDNDLGKLTDNTKKAIRSFRLYNRILTQEEQNYINKFKVSSKTGLGFDNVDNDISILDKFYKNKPLDEKITKDLIIELTNYVKNLSYQIDLLGGVGFDVNVLGENPYIAIRKKLKLFLSKVFSNNDIPEPPNTPDPDIVEKLIKSVNDMSEDQKNKTIQSGIEELKDPKKIEELNKSANKYTRKYIENLNDQDKN